jgi:non-specific serine/threonine protein kinase
MSHPFGDLISQHLHRKHGLSQSKLAAAILQDPSVIGKMCKGQRLTGPDARKRVLAIAGYLRTQCVLATVAEANALLAAAGMSPLSEDIAEERALLAALDLEPIPSAPRAVAPLPQTNLPAPLTSFVGRSGELAAIIELITSQRLVTLTGVGGVGKTRLAVEAGMGLVQSATAGSFADGVWFVELASLAEGSLVAQTIARQLNLPETSNRDALEQLRDYLAAKQLLLILDNCEHLADACASLTDHLLQRCWHLHILATSREELRVPGEVNYAVMPLALPASMERQPERVLASAAARLFMERTRVTEPALQPDQEDVATIAHICRQLDGIPLALELAAPLTRSMTFAEIAAQLHDQMSMLTNKYRTVIPRHQTMHNALVWSYQLLAPAEQQVLARASVFAGGWTVAAARAVCAGDPPLNLTGDVLDHLQQLVLKSWVQADPYNGKRRYRLLEPVRQFAHAQLLAADEHDATRRRHALYYLTLAEQMGVARDTLQERAWLQMLEPERDNLRAVNVWALEQNEAEFSHRLNGALFSFWAYRTNAAEARGWLDAALALRTTLPTPATRRAEAMALDLAGYVAISQGDHGRAQDCFARELALYTENSDQRGIATGLRGCGFAALQRGDMVQAQQYTDRSLAVSQAAQDAWGAAWSLYDIGYLALVRNEFSQAQAVLEEAVIALREQGIQFGVFRALFALAQVRAEYGDTAQARALYREALRLQQQMQYVYLIADCLEGVAGIAAREGQPICAAQLFGAAQAQREATAIQRWRHRDAWYEHDLALARGQLDPDAWHAAWTEGSAMTLEEAVEEALALHLS